LHRKTVAAVFIFICALNQICWGALTNINQLFSEGEKAFQVKDFKAAAQNFSKAVKLAPENLRTRFRYGQALFSLNQYSESYNQFQAILQNSPNNIVARVYLCENLIKLSRGAEAEAHLQWILKVQPGHDRAKELLSQLQNSGKEEIPSGFSPLPVKDVQVSIEEEAEEIQTIESAPETRTAKFSNQNFEPEKKEEVLPPTAVDSNTWDVAQFIKSNEDSFLINLEYGRYSLERGDLQSARTSLARAERLAKSNQDTRKFLEVQILTSLALIYEKDFRAFGKHLMKLKPLLSKQSYKSFLNIYNQARELESEVEKVRLTAGIAMGAGHYAVASDLLKAALAQNPGDILLANLLAEAQMQNLDYRGAETTLSDIARQNQKNAESYFNLSRFYLTASYKPEMARKCAEYAKSLKPQDPRISVMLALLDYAEGRIDTGITRLKQLLPQLEDPGFKSICTRIIEDGKYADSTSGSKRIDFAEVMALPGAMHAPKSSYRLIAVDYLKNGSFFSAMRFFLMAQDLAEVGRTYLGLSSALHISGEEKSASIAAGFGLKALQDELSRNPYSSRANLYLALYHFERKEFTDAARAVKAGLNGDVDRGTGKRLTALLNSLNKTSEMGF
jgi:cytochrome c-type biogenesis protein CcmH/NrfG